MPTADSPDIDAVSAAKVVVIRPSSRWRAIDVSELWRFRDVFWALGMRDVKLRYRQTALGVLWVVLQPLLAAGIFTFVFGRVADMPSQGIPYFLFAYAGLIGWNAFNETVTKTSASLVGNQAMISKIYFPRLLLPLSTVMASVINFVVSAVVLMILVLLTDEVPLRLELLAMPVLLLLVLILGLGLGLLAAASNVIYRDVGYIVPVAVQMLLYASPVAYSVEAVPERLRGYLALNPLTGVLEGFRWSAFGTQLRLGYLLGATVASIGLLVIGAFVFRRMERRFADVI
jgi:lipopolysaccharide transport system permease protein